MIMFIELVVLVVLATNSFSIITTAGVVIAPYYFDIGGYYTRRSGAEYIGYRFFLTFTVLVVVI